MNLQWKARSNKHALGLNTTGWYRIIGELNVDLRNGGRFALAALGLNVWGRYSWPWRKYVA